MAETSAKLGKASKGLGTAAAGVQAIPIFGQILGGILGGVSAGLGAGAAAKAKKEQEERERLAREEAAMGQLGGPSASGRHADRPGGGGSAIGSVFGQMGTGVSTLRGTNAPPFSALSAISVQNMFAQPQQKPEDTGTAGQPKTAYPQDQGLQETQQPQRATAHPQESQDGALMGAELANVFAGLRPGGGGFFA
jgi:hypothetical protein